MRVKKFFLYCLVKHVKYANQQALAHISCASSVNTNTYIVLRAPDPDR